MMRDGGLETVPRVCAGGTWVLGPALAPPSADRWLRGALTWTLSLDLDGAAGDEVVALTVLWSL